MEIKPVIVDCCDLRVPYNLVAKRLSAKRKPSAGLRAFQPDQNYVQFWQNNYGSAPVLFLAHEDCKAWYKDGQRNDEEAIAHCLTMAVYSRLHGIPAAAILMRENEAPLILDDQGLRNASWGWLAAEIDEMLEASLDWSFAHDVQAVSLNIGYHFERLEHENALRFSANALSPEMMAINLAVINHFGKGGSLPLHISQEVSGKRRREIVATLIKHNAPVRI